MRKLLQLLRAALSLIVGEHCAMCGQPLVGGQLCAACTLALPYTHLRGAAGNVLERLFWNDERVQAVSAYCWYKPEYPIAQVVHAFKYHGRRDLAVLLGRAMAQELRSTPMLTSITGLLPVPLSPQRERKRGYNQSRALAEGVAAVTGLPIWDNVVARTVDNPSQTGLTPEQRQANVEQIFTLRDAKPLEGQHVLLIDDVLTIGATLQSLLRALQGIPSLRISILTLCAAGRYREGRKTVTELGLPDLTATYDPNTLRRYRPSS